MREYWGNKTMEKENSSNDSKYFNKHEKQQVYNTDLFHLLNLISS